MISKKMTFIWHFHQPRQHSNETPINICANFDFFDSKFSSFNVESHVSYLILKFSDECYFQYLDNLGLESEVIRAINVINAIACCSVSIRGGHFLSVRHIVGPVGYICT